MKLLVLVSIHIRDIDQLFFERQEEILFNQGIYNNKVTPITVKIQMTKIKGTSYNYNFDKFMDPIKNFLSPSISLIRNSQIIQEPTQ